MDEPLAAIHIITGPTAAGKSALAMHVARERQLAIISADSRQLYRGFDIGTAKPPIADRMSVPHYGIDVLDPGERYSAALWASDARQWMARAEATRTGAVVVGGTGFYIRALLQPIEGIAAPPGGRRERLYGWLGEQPMELLARWCSVLDPARAHLGKTQLLRAIETALLTGERLSDHFHTTDASIQARCLVVNPSQPSLLAARIAERVHRMLTDGWVEEVKRLVATVDRNAPAWNACGYEALREYVEGRLSLDDAVTRVITETRQYAKRQRTWFRNQLGQGNVTHLDPDDVNAEAKALAWWDEGHAAS